MRFRSQQRLAIPGFAVAILLSLAFIAGCKKAVEQVEEIRPVRVEKAMATLLDVQASYSGDVKARYETPLAFRVAGKIIERKVEVGSQVKVGQALAQLDTQDFNLSSQSSEAQLAAARGDFELAKADLDRYRELLSKRFISEAEYQKRETNYNSAKSRLEQVQAQLRQSQNQVRYTTLAATHDGIITSLDAESGQVVSAGQVVMRLARPEEKEVVVAVPENRLDELRLSPDIRVSLWAQPDKPYQGKLREISPGADPVTRTYLAKISITNVDDKVKLGMTASVYLQGASSKTVFALPLTALYQIQGKQPAIWIVEGAANTVRLVPVKLGEYRGNTVTVLEGLSNGQLVVTAGVHKLFAGQKVRPLPTAGS
jgi:RND family efflux transporter MFP subunit